MRICLFGLIILLSFQAQALKRVLIFAPELGAQQDVVNYKIETGIEEILSTSKYGPFSIQIANVEFGRAVSWVVNGELEKISPPPDLVFYYLPARNIARELGEVLSAKVTEDGEVISLLSDHDFCKNTPTVLRPLLSSKVCANLGKSFFFEHRIEELKRFFPNRTKEDLYLSESFFGIYRLFEKLTTLNTKVECLLLISPERVEYFSDLFDQRSAVNSFPLLFLPELSLARNEFKARLDAGMVEVTSYRLLPAAFHSLYRPMNVESGSRRILNSVGVRQWADLLANSLLDYVNVRFAITTTPGKQIKEPSKTK